MPPKKPAARSRKARKPAAARSGGARRSRARKAPARTRAGSKSRSRRPASAARRKTAKTRARAKPAARVKARRKTPARAKTVAKSKATASRTAARPARRAAAARKKPARKAAVKVARKPARAKAPAARTARTRPAPITARARSGKLTRAIAVPSQARRPELAVAEDEEGYEGETRHSLLLGPRNVKPYIERRGEAYMGKEQLDHFRLILTSWKRDLMEEVDRTMTHMKDEAANPPDPNDRATLESEFALELRTRDRERKLIRKIDEALKRIDDGSYGYCLETGEPIGVKRLEARPVATLCIEAQERRERRERQYGDRDDWYR